MKGLEAIDGSTENKMLSDLNVNSNKCLYRTVTKKGKGVKLGTGASRASWLHDI